MIRQHEAWGSRPRLTITTTTIGGRGGLALVGGPLLAARAATAERRAQGEVNVFCGVETDHEGRDVDELVADADVAVLDEHACVVDGLGQSHEEDLSLQAALEEVFRLEVKDVVKLHFVFLQDAVAHQAPQQRIAFEQAAGVLGEARKLQRV